MIVCVLLNTVLSLVFLSCGAVLCARDVRVLLNTILSLVFLSCGAVLCVRDCSCTAQYCSVSRLSFLWCGALYT